MKNSFIQIKDKYIGKGYPPLLIAELSGNHNQSLERALELVEQAAEVGVAAVKLQTYTADAITINSRKEEFIVDAPGTPWHGQSLYELYQKAYTPREWHKPIFDRCNELGLVAFSSPFDESAVDFLEELNVPAYKIASFENNHLPLIYKAASTGKPLIISTGMASIESLAEAVETTRSAGCKDLILLKCTSTYPANPQDANLLTIPDLRKRFDVEVGLSDHTLGIGVSVASVALGATVIEKHFTLNRCEGGVDAAFSMEPDEMKHLAEEIVRAWQALGQISYGPTLLEKKSLMFCRSIYVVENVKKGEYFSDKNLRIIRPGKGLSPKYYDSILGKKSARNIERGTPLTWDCVVDGIVNMALSEKKC